MLPKMSGNPVVAKWKNFLGGLISICLLPTTVVAAIANFNWNTTTPPYMGSNPNPSYTGTDPNPFASYDTSLTTSSQGVLRLYLASGTQSMSSTDIWSITGTFDVTGRRHHWAGLGPTWAILAV